MSSLKKQARFAGLLYLLGALVAPFGLVYAPITLIVKGNATATADNIRAAETTLRWGVASELASVVIFVFLVLALYDLLKSVNQKHAVAMAILLIVSFPLSFIGAVCNMIALQLATGVEWMTTFTPSQIDSLTYLFLRVRGETITAASVFWGLWLFPFGMLVWRSGFIPRWLGVGLWISGAGYVIGAATHVLWPHINEALDPVLTVLAFFEILIIFWLLIWGARETRVVGERSA